MLIAASLSNDRNENPSNDDPDRVHVAVAPPTDQNPAQNNQNYNNLFFLNDTRNYPPLNSDITEQADSLASFKPITRELMIRFLKLEKFRLQKMKTIKTVSDLLDYFITQSDLNRE